MNVIIIATKSCSHRPTMEHELKDLGVEYNVIYVEENPKIVTKYAIRHSPNLVIDDEVVCRGLPSEGELKVLLSKKRLTKL
jgi:glutaredoxin